MKSAMLCFLFLVILVNDTCIFAKLVLVQIQIHSVAIMGKPTAAPKKAAKEKVKSKAKAKAKAASQALVVQPVEDANDVSRAEISKFITALKYKAKNPKDPQAQGAQMVLEDRGCKKK